MREIINRYPIHDLSNAPHWTVRKNPENIYDIQFVLNTRIFIFEQTSVHLHIDFAIQTIEPDCLYIVPPLHFHFLRRNIPGNFLCIDIDDTLISNRHKQLFFITKYNKQKSLPKLNVHDDCTYNNVMAFTLKDYDKTTFISRLSGWIESRITFPLGTQQKPLSYNHISIADHFLKLLSEKKLTLEGCKVKTLATELFCSERTLHRICTKVFGLCALEVSYYHFTLKAIYLLADYKLSYLTIAFELQFSSVSSFNHFIKNNTGFTPSQIRESLRNTGL